MKTTLHLTLGLFLALILHAAPASTTEALGASAAAELKKNLKAALSKELGKGNIAGAIEVCSTQAMPLTAKSAEIDPAVLSIERRTDRWRNPANDTDALDLKAMASLRADKKLKQLTVRESDEIERYYQPLRIMPMCLACHGAPETFSPEVTQALRTNYAEDRAINYKDGDLRGVIQVRIQSNPAK